MTGRVAIVGVGATPCRTITPDVSYKEMMFEAAQRAYSDCGLDPRKDVDSFVTCAEDFWEGTSIFDEYVPDQLGAVLKPTCTIASDGIYGVATAYMQIAAGAFEVVAVEAHSKASEVLDKAQIQAFALDPIYNRPIVPHPYLLAGLEMRAFLKATKNTAEQCSAVVEKNRGNALHNPWAARGSHVTRESVDSSEPLFEPLRQLDVAQHADSSVVLVLASGDRARRISDRPIWIRGVGWYTDDGSLETRDWRKATYAAMAAERAFEMAGINDPAASLDFAEIDDTFSYKELQHMEAAGLCAQGESGRLAEEGATTLGGELPVNPSGGSIGMGNLLEANGLMRIAQSAIQLRGEAGANQITSAQRCLALSWRGLPTTSGAAVVLERVE